MPTALTKTTIGGKNAVKGVAYCAETRIDADQVVVIAASEDALKRTLQGLGVYSAPDFAMVQNVIVTKDEEPSHG